MTKGRIKITKYSLAKKTDELEKANKQHHKALKSQLDVQRKQHYQTLDHERQQTEKARTEASGAHEEDLRKIYSLEMENARFEEQLAAASETEILLIAIYVQFNGALNGERSMVHGFE